jgi:ribosome recycling factor
MLEDLKKQHREKMDQAITDLVHVFNSIRTGRASIALLDGIQVDAYGSKMPLKQLASLNTPDARTIAIQPFDPNQIAPIEKAIRASNLGINPTNDGRIIRLVVPLLTEERRKELVKVAHKYAEEHRVAVRQVRHHFIDEVKKLEKDKKIAEDERYREVEDGQKLTDEYIKKIDAELKKKEAEIMEV